MEAGCGRARRTREHRSAAAPPFCSSVNFLVRIVCLGCDGLYIQIRDQNGLRSARLGRVENRRVAALRNVMLGGDDSAHAGRDGAD